MTEVIVLRNAAAVRTASPFEFGGPSITSMGPAGPPEPQIEKHDIPLHEAIDLARDPNPGAADIPPKDSSRAVRTVTVLVTVS